MLVIDYLFGYFVPFLAHMNRFATPLQQKLSMYLLFLSTRPVQSQPDNYPLFANISFSLLTNRLHPVLRSRRIQCQVPHPYAIPKIILPNNSCTRFCVLLCVCQC